MDEAKYENALQIILHAGNAKSNAMLAIEAAEEGDLAQAREHMDVAREEMKIAHKVQFDLVQSEASGTPVEVTIILVHAQDHLTMAIMAIDFAEHFIKLYRDKAETASDGQNATAGAEGQQEQTEVAA